MLCALFFLGAVSIGTLNTESTLPFHFIDLNCTGDEDNIWNCTSNNLSSQYSCLYNHDAAIACQEGTNSVL